MKVLADQLFEFSMDSAPKSAYRRCSAKDLGIDESWFRDRVFDNPELVIGPCRAAGITNDDWYPWRKEFQTEVGRIDVLLLSSQGRVAIVETKLASNPELRRKVLAQALDYLAHLPSEFVDSLPDIPNSADGTPIAEPDDIQAAITEGDVLLIIASDECDPRVAKLSQSLLADNLVKHWDLALVDLGLYHSSEGGQGRHIIVSHLRNTIQSEARQVVRVVVQGDRPTAKVQVERIVPEEAGSRRTDTTVDPESFFNQLERQHGAGALASWRQFVEAALSANIPDLTISYRSWGQPVLELTNTPVGTLHLLTISGRKAEVRDDLHRERDVWQNEPQATQARQKLREALIAALPGARYGGDVGRVYAPVGSLPTATAEVIAAIVAFAAAIRAINHGA